MKHHNSKPILKIVFFFLLISIFIPAAAAQTGVTCTAFVANQPTLRQEGTTEPVGDILISCSGTLIGAQTGVQTLSLYVNYAAITSRQLYTGSMPFSIPTEAALLVNDCVTNSGTSSSGGNCAPSGTFLGGIPAQGFLQNGALVFTGFTLPTTGAPFQIRITNVRVNANQVASGTFITGTVLATFGIQNQQNLVLGAVQSSLGVSVASPLSAVPQCQAQTNSINNLTIRELVTNAFKSPAAAAANSTPGQWYQNGVNSESQTVLTSHPSGWTNQTNAIPGQADTATRLRVNLTNIPVGATVTMPVTISNGFGASLVANASGDLGAFSPAGGVGIPITGTGSVTYEVRAQTANVLDSFTVPMTVTSSGSTATGTVLVSVTYAPNPSETTTQFPMFVDTSVFQPLVSVVSCQNATQVQFATQPGSGKQGFALPAFTVQLLDGLGNITGSNAAVTVTSAPSGVSVTTNAVNGFATFNNVVFNSPGIYTLTASSSGLTSATSRSFTINGPSTVTLTSSLNSFALYEQNETLTATVSPSAATGTVTFYDGTNVLGTSPVLSGQASLTTTLSNVGNRTLLAHYNGSLLYAAGTSQPLFLTVNAIGEGGFAAAGNFTAGQSIQAVGTADLNGDGVPDVIVTDINNNLDVLLGNTNGTLQPAASLPVGVGPQGFATADFNGDGKTDVVVAGSVISVLLGKGNGTFQNAITVPAGANPVAVAVGDFNGDGNADLAVTQFNTTGTVLILLGNGDGTFQNVGTYVVGSQPGGVAVGDFNNDGKVDLAVTNYNSNNVSVLLGNGDGTFQTAVPYAAGVGPRPIVVGDFNGDGRLDLAVGNSFGGVSVLLGNGDGTFATQALAAAGIRVTGLVVGDFNADGKLDLAFTPNGGNTVNFLLGAGNGTFPSVLSYTAGSSPIGIALGDFNRDGKIDLVLANGTGSVSVLLGTASNPAQLKFTTQPVNTPPGGSMASVVVQVQDATGNPVLTSNAAVTLTSNPAGTSGTVNAVNGVATFSGLTFGIQGSYTFTASSPGLTSATSTSFTITGTPPPSVVIDSPAPGVAPPGPLLVISGWAIDNISSVGTAISGVKIYIDGTFVGNATYGVSRPDVCAAYPGRAGCPNVGFTYTGLVEAGTHVITVTATDTDSNGAADTGSASVTITLSGGVGILASRAGVFRNNVSFLEDSNGNGVYDAGTDRFIPGFTGTGGFVTGDIPVTGDWTGDGKTKVGIYRSSTGQWFLDLNNDGVFNAGDVTYTFGGLAGDVPFTGDWTNIGKSCIGIYRPGGSVWLLDLNCNGVFENTPTDAFFPFGGLVGDVPVVGNWFGTGTRPGVVRKYAPGGVTQGDPFLWVLDGGAANAGNLPVNHPTAANPFGFGGLPGDVFVSGDWYTTGKWGAGVYRNGFWVLDAALPGAAQQYHLPGVTFGYGGAAGDIPVVGKW